MSVTGIIAEFNPLHNGHKYLIETAKEKGDKVVVVLSSDFVQRGDCAIYNKSTRTKAALICGADLVIELPTVWSMSGAEKFALGSVFLLKSTNIVNSLTFGVQDDNLSLINDIAYYLNSVEFKEEIKNRLNTNKTFATIREEIIKSKFNISEDMLKDGNNILAIEYIRACLNLGFNPTINTVKRIGTSHDSSLTTETFAGATYIREQIRQNSLEDVEKFIPAELFELYHNSDISDFSRLHNAILFKLRSMNEEYFKELPDLSEGIENRFYKAVQSAKSFDELLEILKTKRYTLSRIRRLVLNAALGIFESDSPALPPYIRVLGFNNNGEELVKEISKHSTLPIIINSKQAQSLNGVAENVFKKQSEITDLYNLAFKSPNPCGSDYSYNTVKIDIKK